MTVIELPDDQAAALRAKAAAQGLSLEAWFQSLASDDADTLLPSETVSVRAAAPPRHISEVIRELMRDVPPEVWAQLPTDGASEHDHYIYGLPKRNL